MKKIIGILTVLLLSCLLVMPANAEDTGGIYVTSEPSGAKVWIDHVLQDHITPYRFDGIPVGGHDVQVYADGYMGSYYPRGFDTVVVYAGQITSKHYVLEKYAEPDITVTESHREHNMELTNKQLLPGDIVGISVDLSPPALPGMQTPWRWLEASWDNTILSFWYHTLICANDDGEDGYGEYEGNSYNCEEPLPGTFLFKVLISTPLRTFTSVIFKGGFTDWSWGEGTGDRVVEESVDIYVPEYPSPYIPAIVVGGFLGIVLLIKRTREN